MDIHVFHDYMANSGGKNLELSADSDDAQVFVVIPVIVGFFWRRKVE